MASEKDIELLDDFLANRLGETDRKAVETRLNSDPEFRQEFEHQQLIVNGIRLARATELKAMLNNVPLSGIGVEPSTTTVKLIAALLAVGLTATVLYYYSEHTTDRTSTLSESVLENVQEQAPSGDSLTAHDTSDTKTENLSADEASPVKPKTPLNQPRENAPTSTEVTLQKERDLIAVVSKTFVTSSTEVITERGDDQYTFHYAFRDKKLVLFGAFRKNEYQILEFITDREHIFFLDYNQNYYLLDENTATPTPLTPIQDPDLRQKLREFRAN